MLHDILLQWSFFLPRPIDTISCSKLVPSWSCLCLDLENPINLEWVYGLLALSVVLLCSRSFLTTIVMWELKWAWCRWRYKVAFKESLPTARIPITLMVSSVVETLFYNKQITGIPLNVVEAKKLLSSNKYFEYFIL